MPCISQFYGISIYMYHKDHAPPHFHAIYAEYEAEINIDTGDIDDGTLPRRARKFVSEWWADHRDELRQNWNLARAGKPLNPVSPLD